MANTKKLTLLHSNDLHGDFLAEQIDDKLVGGVSLLSGYVSKVRAEEKNCIYVIAGDMFRGSVIDSEYRGISTIEIMNALSPDVVTIGNHEVDYGLAHLLFIEKCAKFPIINANLHVRMNGARLFKPYEIIEIDGMKILFIGITTEEIISSCVKEGMGTFVDIAEAAEEVGKICNAYNATDIDLTVLLTHIGFEMDLKLAELLDPAWGVDMIIGGHTHTVLDEPAVVNNIPIVQAGIGTDIIGRFDITIDTDRNCIQDYTWGYVEINDKNCPKDLAVEEVIEGFKSQTDIKYNRVVTRFGRQLTHPSRLQETELGDLFSDVLTESLGIDCLMFASGGIRKTEMGPLVLYRDLVEAVPYDEPVYMFMATGKQFKEMIRFMLRDEAFAEGAHTEFYQLPGTFRISYSKSRHEFDRFDFKGAPLADDDLLKVASLKYHWANIGEALNMPQEELAKNGKPRVISTSATQVIEEYLSEHNLLVRNVNGRLNIID